MSSHEVGQTPRQAVADRVTVSLVPRVNGQLQLLQERTGMSKTDLVNRAITLYEYLEGELSKGNDLLLRIKDTGDTYVVKVL